MRACTYYLIAAILLTIYGGQVCPFIETLTPMELALIVSGWLSLFFVIRASLAEMVIGHLPQSDQPGRQFYFEILMFMAAGLAMAFFNMSVFGFPFPSGLKLFAGCLTIGFFAAADLALEREYRTALSLDRVQETSLARFTPISRKMVFTAMALTVFVSIVLTLVITHDISWIRNLPANSDPFLASRSIIIEITFVLVILFAFSANLIVSYTRNLKFYFYRQTEALKDVAAGKLDGHIPITTNDEFGVIADYTNRMIAALKDRTEQLQVTQDVTIMSLASLAETRDNETGQHLVRTQNYILALAERLRDHSYFSRFLTEENISLIFKSAPLHDIGKVGIPDQILLKPGKLSVEEFEIMKGHARLGREALMQAIRELGDSSFLHFAQEIAYSHHEKWDGSGYPEGLRGDDIPVSGRLMALADVYDALISKRVYKEAFSHEQAVSLIREGRGSHFDPKVVDCFLEIEQQFRDIADKHRDRP